MVAVAEIRRGVSPEEFLYVVRVLRRRESAPSGKPHVAHIDASRQAVEVWLRLVKPVFETAAAALLPTRPFPATNRQNKLRLRPPAPSFEGPRQISLQLEYGVPR